MLKVCLDTNVWISGLAFSGIPAEIVSLAFNRKFQVVTSTLILEELNRNLVKKFDVNPKRARPLCFRIEQISDVYEPKGNIQAVSGGKFQDCCRMDSICKCCVVDATH
ncbi:MAG: putative toxin-antitoxin system toxin component, PIN family [Bdellovibrionales bacterium]|jgi:putative PIN family toxin of toxin-antitoxin system|nr:putative toxin-antitoxin system toxin component, PIN family [Bdellovibrionales bacterium]